MSIVQQLQQVFRSLFQWWVVIAPWQQGVRVRAGKHVKLLRPGIHLKLPIIDVVYMQPIRLRAHYVKEQTLTTSDGKTITLASALQYEIDDLLLMYRTLHNAHDTIEQQTQSIVAGYIHRRKLSEITPVELEEFVAESLDLERYGLCVRAFHLTNFAISRAYRFISGEIGSFTGYDQRLETSLAMGEEAGA